MDEHCLVMCGEWICGDDGKWDFVIDKQMISRVVQMSEHMDLVELKERVLREFYGEGVVAVSPSLSYWPLNSMELATGKTTPPVLVTNTGAISFFFKHLCADRRMNMLVSFSSEADYITPAQPKKRRNVFQTLNEPTRSGSGFEEFGSYGSSVGSKNLPVYCKDEDILSHVQEAEAKWAEGSIRKQSRCSSEETILSDSEENCREVPSDVEVREAGYDKEFWKHIIDDPLTGTDAFNVLCPERDDLNGKKIENDMKGEYFCTTNDAFDHKVIPEGTHVDAYPKAARNKKAVPNKCGCCQQSGHNRTR
ncbi:unnamed protein product [Thlaspi arvense]|uniref:Uncharacterized protein n=1 Tax=Thlaspi arvense TaxID=13288 RepID=A0AAU9RCE3_THLAR|nr:unnamed protein product [Thlaspi arvense]